MYSGGFNDMLKMMNLRKKKLQNIQRNALLLQQLTHSFRTGMDRDMNNTSKKAKFVFTDSLQDDMMKQIENRLSKGKPNVDTVAQLTEDIYQKIGNRYKQNKTIGHVVNQTHSKVVGGGKRRAYVPHATVRVRLDKKTGQYEMNIWAPKTESRQERTGKINGTVKVDQRLKERLKEQIQSNTRNFLAGNDSRKVKTVESLKTVKFSQSAEFTSKRQETFKTIKPSTEIYPFTLTYTEEKTDIFSEEKRAIDEKITLEPLKTARLIKTRRATRPALKKTSATKVARTRRTPRKSRLTGSRQVSKRTRKQLISKSEEIPDVSTVLPKDLVGDMKETSSESLRKTLDRHIQMLFNQTRVMHEKGKKGVHRQPGFSILDNIEKEIGPLASSWPDLQESITIKTTLPKYGSDKLKESQRPSTKPWSESVTIATAQTARTLQEKTIKPAVKRVFDTHFTYLPRVFTFQPITLKAFVPTTRKRYIFTRKFIYNTEEDSVSDSDRPRGKMFTTKRKSEKPTKKLQTLPTAQLITPFGKSKESIIHTTLPTIKLTTPFVKPTLPIVKLTTPFMKYTEPALPTIKLTTPFVKPTLPIVKLTTPFMKYTEPALPTIKLTTPFVKPTLPTIKLTTPFMKYIEPTLPTIKLTPFMKFVQPTLPTIKLTTSFMKYAEPTLSTSKLTPSLGKSTEPRIPIDAPSKPKENRTVYETLKDKIALTTIMPSLAAREKSIIKESDTELISERATFQHTPVTPFIQHHYFTFGTVRGGYKQFDDNWWRLSNRNRIRSANSRFAQPLHLRGKTFSQRPLRSYNRNVPFKSVKSFLSGIRKVSTTPVPFSNTLVPFLQPKIQRFYKKSPPSIKRTIRPYYNIRLHPMNPVDSMEDLIDDTNKIPTSNITDRLINITAKPEEEISTEKEFKVTEKITKPESFAHKYFKEEDEKSFYTTRRISLDGLKTISSFLSTTDSSESIITSPVPEITTLPSKKPGTTFMTHREQTTSRSLPDEDTKYVTSATVRTTPTDISSMSEKPPPVKVVSEMITTTEALTADASITQDWFYNGAQPTSKLPPAEQKNTTSVEITQKVKSYDNTEESAFGSSSPRTVSTITISKLPRFNFVWPTFKREMLTTQAAPATLLTTRQKPTTDRIVETLSTVIPEMPSEDMLVNLVWPTFQIPTTTQTTTTTTQAPTITTDKFIPRVVWPTFQQAMIPTVIPTEYIPRAFWPTPYQYHTIRPKRVSQTYKNLRWIPRPRERLRSDWLRKTPYPKVPVPSKIQTPYETTTDITTVQPTIQTASEVTKYPEVVVSDIVRESPETVTTVIATETVQPTYHEMSTHRYETIKTPIPTEITVETSKTTQPILSTQQSTPELSTHETSTLAEEIKIIPRTSQEVLDPALFPDLDELLEQTSTLPPPTTTRARRRKSRPTKWWIDYIYPDLYKKHVEDSSYEDKYYSNESEEDYTFLPFDYNTTGTPFYRKLRFGGTYYTFRPIYVRPTTPEPPTTMELTTTHLPTTKPTKKKTQIHHFIKKGFKKILNIFNFGKRSKVDEEKESE